MNKGKIIAKLLYLTGILFLTINSALSQDSKKKPLDTLDTIVSVSFSNYSSLSVDYSLHHWSTKNDSLVYHKHKELITSDPSENNYKDYYSLACSLWGLNKLTESKKMFQKIVDSGKPFYTDTYHRSSDIPGDTTINRYGYGSYTFNYKNRACLYLTKINLEKKLYKTALEFLELADKKYLVEQNCGTGHNWYRGEIEGLYSLCYYGLGMYDTIIEKYLSNYSDYRNGILVKSIKKKYTEKEINDYLIIAEKSIECVVDTFQSSSYTIHEYGTKNEKTVQSNYTSGKGTINLFGIKLDMPSPDLENGESVSRELFLNKFKESGFYKALTK